MKLTIAIGARIVIMNLVHMSREKIKAILKEAYGTIKYDAVDSLCDLMDSELTEDVVSGVVEPKGRHLFKNSPYFDIKLFRAALQKAVDNGIDVDYYYHSVKDWSEAGAHKKVRWIPTARNFMRRDMERGSLKKVITQVRLKNNSAVEKYLKT